MVTGGMIGIAALSLVGIIVCAVTHTDIPPGLQTALMGCLIGLGVIFTPAQHVLQVPKNEPSPKP